MAVVTQMNHGMWFIHWTAGLESQTTFQCEGTTFELTSSSFRNQLALSLKENEGNMSFILPIIY
jgi:hypothetical protein